MVVRPSNRLLLRRLIVLYSAAGAALVVDQSAKAYVLRLFQGEEGRYVRLVDDFLWLRLLYNTGAAFGMLRSAQYIFVIAAVLVILGIVLYSRRLAQTPWIVRLAVGLQLGGALTNLVDRAVRRHVVDYIDFRVWPYVFNLGDVAITIGVILLLIHLFRDAPERRPAPGQSVDG